SDCLIMAYAHVAHDCLIGDHAVIANAVNMGGHCDIGDWVIVGGLTAIHQFVQIGAHAFVGGSSAVRKDVPPYVKAAGDPLRLFGLNSVGLQRRGFSESERAELRRAYRMLFRSKANLRDALAARLNVTAPATRDTLLDGVDAVIIAVPTVAHEEVALAAIERGVHILIEKPIAPSLEAADRICDAADAAGVIVMIGHVERFN